MLSKVKDEPVMAAATLIALALGVVGITTDASSVAEVLTVALPLVAGLLARMHVTPNSKL